MPALRGRAGPRPGGDALTEVASTLGHWLRYARTAGGLRWSQWVYRPVRRVQARLPVPVPTFIAPPHPGRAARLAGVWEAAGPGPLDERLRRADDVLRGRFELVGHAEDLPRVEWGREYVSPLWTYNLHYFDFAADLAWAFRATGDAAYARRFEALADGWIAWARGRRGTGWAAYPTSLRAVNWIRARGLFGDALDGGFRERLDASIYRQLCVVERRTERDLLANHLQKNLHALAVGGLFFAGGAADRWRTGTLRRLWRELRGQVLGDGGHFERSPMYHAIALGDFLELLALLDACAVPVPADARGRVRAMASAWRRLSRPDGEPRLFNDAAEGVAPPAAYLERLATLALGEVPARAEGAWSLPETGFFGWEGGEGESLVVDCGPPGPRCQPGHVHCDLLSFELDLGGRRVVVDSGVSGYAGDPLRGYARGTRAHNTVMIGGLEQSEVWGVFRVGGMARVHSAAAGQEGSVYRFEGAYGPHHARSAVHRRTISGGRGAWRVADRVSGAAGTPLASFLHLHPDFDLLPEGGGFVARAAGMTVRIEPFGVDEARIARGERDPAQGWYCPRFGTALPAPALELGIDGNDGREFGYTIRRVKG